jgi:hypothetical protein
LSITETFVIRGGGGVWTSALQNEMHVWSQQTSTCMPQLKGPPHCAVVCRVEAE